LGKRNLDLDGIQNQHHQILFLTGLENKMVTEFAGIESLNSCLFLAKKKKGTEGPFRIGLLC